MFKAIRKYLGALGTRIMALAGREYMGMSVREWFNMPATGTMTDAGIYVDSEVAQKASAVFACMRLLGGTAGSLPCQVFKRLPEEGRELDTSHSYYNKFHGQPNPLMSSFTYWQSVVHQIHFYGNAYTWLLRKGSGEVEYPLLLDSRRVTPIKDNMRWLYEIELADNTKMIIDQDDMLDFPNLFYDLKTGRGASTISAGAQAIGLGLVAEAHSARFFANSALSSIAVRFPQKVSPELKDEIVKYIKEKAAGKNVYSPLVLSEGGDVTALTMKAEDAQLLQSRAYQVEDIARWFGVPAWMIGSTEKVTSWGSGVEQYGIAFVVYSLRSMLTMIEQELDRKLFRDGKRFFEFNVAGLLRGDIKTRYEAYRIALGGNQIPGFMSKNAIRKLENLPPDDDPESDQLYKPSPGANVGSENNGQAAEATTEQ